MMKTDRILDIEIEKLILGELDPDRIDAVEKAIEEQPDVKSRYEALQTSNKEILAEYPVRMMAAEIRDRHERQETRGSARRPISLMIPALAATAAAVFLVYVMVPDETPIQPEEPAEVIRIKGAKDPTLFVFRKGLDAEELLKNGSTASAGDVIQLKYAARGAAHGVILSVDGRDTVTLHYPVDKKASTALGKGASVALNFSYELDDAPDFERFFFVTSNKPIDVRKVLRRARRLDTPKSEELELDKGLSQSDFVLNKKNRNP